MSYTQVPDEVVLDTTLSPTARLVYIRLLSYARGKDSAFPCQRRLADDVGLKVRQLSSRLRELEAAGYVRTEKRGRANRYYLAYQVRHAAGNSGNAGNRKGAIAGTPPPVDIGSELPPNHTGGKLPGLEAKGAGVPTPSTSATNFRPNPDKQDWVTQARATLAADGKGKHSPEVVGYALKEADRALEREKKGGSPVNSPCAYAVAVARRVTADGGIAVEKLRTKARLLERAASLAGEDVGPELRAMEERARRRYEERRSSQTERPDDEPQD